MIGSIYCNGLRRSARTLEVASVSSVFDADIVYKVDSKNFELVLNEMDLCENLIVNPMVRVGGIKVPLHHYFNYMNYLFLNTSVTFTTDTDNHAMVLHMIQWFIDLYPRVDGRYIRVYVFVCMISFIFKNKRVLRYHSKLLDTVLSKLQEFKDTFYVELIQVEQISQVYKWLDVLKLQVKLNIF